MVQVRSPARFQQSDGLRVRERGCVEGRLRPGALPLVYLKRINAENGSTAGSLHEKIQQ